jgi:hypothetical protein
LGLLKDRYEGCEGSGDSRELEQILPKLLPIMLHRHASRTPKPG